MNITKELAIIMARIWKDKEQEIRKTLSWRGKYGGGNARYWDGWDKSPSAGWTKAAKAAGVPRAKWWEAGNGPTPSTGLPAKLIMLVKCDPAYSLIIDYRNKQDERKMERSGYHRNDSGGWTAKENK